MARVLAAHSLTPPEGSLPLHGFLSLCSVKGGHVLRGGDEVQDADARFQQADCPTETLQPVEPGSRFLNIMENVEQAEEQLVSSTHHKQHWLRSVVDSENGVSRQVDGLVTG